LADLARKRGRRPDTTGAAVEKRVAPLRRRHPARPYVPVTGGSAATGPTRRWTRAAAALAAAAARDGRYVRGTHAPTRTAAEQWALSKQREGPEKRDATVKGPLAVRPVYRPKEARLGSLVFGTLVALLGFALLEGVARRAGVPQSGPVRLERFSDARLLGLSCADGSPLRRVRGLDPPEAELLRALGWPPATRYTVGHP
jgi:hypothetical protein